MYLSKLIIKNFRSITSCEVNFTPGLNVLIGENNIGKSTVIDALRVLLPTAESQSLNISERDIKKDNPDQPIEFEYVFDGLSIDEEAIFIEALRLHEDKYCAHFYISLRPGKYERRLASERWCGTNRNQSIPSGMMDQLISVYLPPLRNPAEGLKPGYGSQIAKLLRTLASEEDKSNLEKRVLFQNDELKEQSLIIKAQKEIDAKLKNIIGDDLSQNIDLSFTGNDFKKILGRLGLFIDGMEIDQNGLGYNNIVFTAAVLSQLKNDNNTTYRALLIEEPEAHLHPQMQTLLLQHLSDVTKDTMPHMTQSEDSAMASSQVQVIVTSHSPILASKAPLDSIVSLHTNGSDLNCVSLAKMNISKNNKQTIERFLDATRAEIFFAKRIIMVEGISEALLLPLFANRIGTNLDKKCVSIVNVQGLNFKTFLELVGYDGVKIPCSIITDSDSSGDEDSLLSSAAQKLKDKENDLTKVFLANNTFEYELALNIRVCPQLV